MPSHLWEYFDLESEKLYPTPEEPIRTVLEAPASSTAVSASSTAASSQTVPGGTRAASLNRALKAASRRSTEQLKEDMDFYYKEHTIYRDALRQWKKFHEVEAKLREQILATVATRKASPLTARESARQWLKDLKASTEPSKAIVRQSIKVDYQRSMSVDKMDWPTDGPSAWIAKWEDLIFRAR